MEGKMKKLLFVVSLVLLFCLVVDCQKPVEKPTLSVNTKTELDAIRELFMALGKGYEAKDVDRICSCVTDDFLAPYASSFRDIKWVRELLVHRFSGTQGWKIYLPDRIEISASGDLAYALCYVDFPVVTKGEAGTIKGGSLYVLKKQKDGSWKFVTWK
jgi:ketosteroid isomerase-like protein